MQAEVRLGAVSAKASPPWPEISCAVDDRHNDDVFDAHPVDDSVVADEKFSLFLTPELRNLPATIRQSRERFRCFEQVVDKLGGS